MVTHDGEKRNIGFGEFFENGQRAHDISQRRTAVVEQVTGVDDGVGVVRDGVSDHLPERIEEVVPSVGDVVLLIPDVGIAGVYHPCHLPTRKPAPPKGVS